MKTWSAKEGEVPQRWFLVDASGKSVGRLSTQIATVLRGKNRPTFTPHMDTGDSVIVINAEKAEFTGNKWQQKKYYKRSKYIGSLQETTAEEMRESDPTFIIKNAVKGMLPTNKLSRQLIKKLKVYSGAEHPHEAQKPEALNI